MANKIFTFVTVFCFVATLAAVAAASDEKVNSVGARFVLIPAGTFMMGLDRDARGVLGDEVPRHRVTVSKAFYLGKYEVTQAEWRKVMGENPSSFKGDANPVETVSWEDAQAFIEKLNQMEGTARYRLPTEAEWEYAARAGSELPFISGDDETDLGRFAWHEDNAFYSSHPVGEKEPNAWGLHDMIGNVWEWAFDWHGRDYYAQSPETDPQGPPEGERRICRGCAWLSGVLACRFTDRLANEPDVRGDFLGFRLAFDVEER
ncbi:MAG: formylglycine-generating enzyme family protein [Deltaproteobacteria bacterium]|nr:formylglycine-generating enzyme family protein [Deltaproteobacteria bacterium]